MLFDDTLLERRDVLVGGAAEQGGACILCLITLLFQLASFARLSAQLKPLQSSLSLVRTGLDEPLDTVGAQKGQVRQHR